MTLVAAPLLFAAWVPARAEDAGVEEAIRWGTVATLAPLCGLRDEGWGFDLRRAAILEGIVAGGGAARPDDWSLRAAPGSGRAVGALSFGEAEALEDFAGAPGPVCGGVAGGAELGRADEMVRAFRRLRAGS